MGTAKEEGREPVAVTDDVGAKVALPVAVRDRVGVWLRVAVRVGMGVLVCVNVMLADGVEVYWTEDTREGTEGYRGIGAWGATPEPKQYCGIEGEG